MSWSYSVADLATSTKDQVRLEIQDTNTNLQLLQDEEIEYAISQEATMWGAAARCAEIISRNYLQQADRRMGLRLFILYSKMAEQYSTMAKALRAKAVAMNLPYVGGISVTDKSIDQSNTDAVQPAFSRGMQSNPYQSDPNS